MRFQLCAFVSVLVLAGTGAAAQDLSAGVDAGLVLTSLPQAGEVFDQVARISTVDSSSKFGGMFGGFVTVPLTDEWSLQPEMQFVVKGVTLAQAGGGTAVASIRYLEIPILMRYAATFGDYKGFLLAGPTLALKASTSAHVETASQTVDVNLDPAIRTFDGGIVLAGGIDYQQYFFEARYTFGLRDVAVDAYPHADSIRNRAFAILAGIRLK